ncbi:MAG: S-layer homology domain-containing protein [Clostridiaceae bacterium]
MGRKRIRKSLAAILSAVLVYSILGSCLYGVFAAVSKITIEVENYENGKLDISWNQPSGAKAAVIAYHKPNADDTAALVVSGAILSGNKASISGLKDDYIYDITVTVYGEIDADNKPVGEPIGRGILFYLPSITFRSDAGYQAYVGLLGGGREIGATPTLKLSWKIPKSFYDPENTVYPDVDSNPNNNVFIPGNQANALAYMQNSLNQIYNDGRVISTLNFRINISTELNLLNSGSTQASLLISQNATAYTVNVSRDAVHSADVTAPDSQGFVSFELWGRADETSTVPTQIGTTPAGIYVLPDNEIYPGTVYYMNIKPIFKDASGANVPAVTAGNPEDQNGSLISGDRSYTSTPIRFQLTKDSANNIYVKIYKINQGSLDLPRLFYEVQATDDPAIAGDWVVKKTMDDSYFSGESAVTVISGVNPDNEVYYKIVVKSDSPSDRLESLPMPYTLTVDTGRPPLPTGIAIVDRNLKSGQVTTPSNATLTIKSTDVTISWDKPANWETLKKDLYYHFLLNTNQSEITEDVPLYVDGTYWGSYPAEYRLVKYVSALSSSISEEGNRLSYTMKAYDLFKWEGSTPAEGGDITGNGNYPHFLIPNTVYYLQMYTTNAGNEGKTEEEYTSDRSIITSFTTLNGAQLDVPLPMSFSLDVNGKTVAPVLNFVELKFDKITNIDWSNYTNNYDETKYSYEVYYDIYMNTRTNTPFTVRIGTTEELHGDVGFTGADDPQSTSIKARISKFTAADSKRLFGENLQPNTTYYFTARTRLVIKNRADGSTVSTLSAETAILPVTTIVLEVTAPDDSQRKPLAPTDFSIALDSDQNQLLSGSSVTFTWVRQEEDVLYQLIRTTRKVSPTDGAGSYGTDPEYVSFLQEYDTLSDSLDNDFAYLDPAPATGHPTHPGKFTYDSATKVCTYTVDRRMFPNKLYYFSLKAVRVKTKDPLETGSQSVWVSIPVTTSLIEAPLSLEAVVNASLGFCWTDATYGLTAEDFKIYAKGPSDADFKLISRSQSTIVKDTDGETYYGRITGLKPNSCYDIRVIKGANTTVYEKAAAATRDGYHELEIKWLGKPMDNYSRYDIAIMAEGASEYTVLSASDLEQYVDRNGSVLPYYTEETALTLNSDAIYYHARIKSARVVLPGGMVANQPLRSNIKYYIKVRTVKADPIEADLIAYSKYIGPVSSRTEFNQDDYDNTDREEQEKATFLDRLADLEKGYYWRVAIGNSSASKILLKGDRVADAMTNTSSDSFVVDMTDISVNISTDEIYVPVSVLRTMNSLNRSLVIRTSGAELLLRPASLNANSEQIKEILDRQEVKDLYAKMVIMRSGTSSAALPANCTRVSDIHLLGIQVMGLSRADSDLKQLFHDRLYDEESGLVSEKLSMLLNTYVGSGPEAAKLIDQYTKNLIGMIENELSVYIDNTLQSVKLSYTVRDVTSFDTPVSASLNFTGGSGVMQPYVIYDGTSFWQKITESTLQTASSISFSLLKTGKYVILSSQGSIGGIPAGYWAESYVTSLSSKYDLSDIFPEIGSNFMPENYATCREVVLLYEKVTGKAAENAGLDIRQKNVRLGLDGVISPNSLLKSVNRQETAAVLLKLFAAKKGIGTANLIPGGRVYITDESSIEEEYYNPVLMIVDMNVMSLDESGNFYPGRQMTRAEVVAAFVKLLEKTGY